MNTRARMNTYQIKEVADIAGVSQRALRHYDEIGLLKPSLRSAAGYRLYTESDLLRLQQILIGRSLGLALEDIRRSLDDTSMDRKSILLRQRLALTERAQATQQMIESIDAALALLDRTQQEEEQSVDMKKLFDGFDPARYEGEVAKRWGHTDAYAESARRTRRYTQEDWRAIKEASDSILSDAVALLHASVAPSDPRATHIAERYRLWVDRWFYPCDRTMHTNLGEMYEADSRFSGYFEDRAAGLAAFLSAAIRANTAERTGDGGVQT